MRGSWYIGLFFGAALLSGCDPAYSKRFLVKEGAEKPYAESRLDLLGIDRETVKQKIEALCTENEMEPVPEAPGLELHCRKRTKESTLFLCLELESEKYGAYVVLLDFGAFSQSGLSKKLEQELADFAAFEKSKSK